MTALAAELRHHPNVPSLEVYDEENVTQWWEGTREQYARTLDIASRAARIHRRFEIVAGGLVFPDVEWMEDLCAQPGVRSSFDVVAVHAYPETWTPAGVTAENYFGAEFEKKFVRAVDRACGRKRVWINETGFATTPGKTEMDQAAWWVRAIATFAAEPRVEHIGVYEIKDLAAEKAAIGDAPNYHRGVARSDRTPKLAFATIKRVVELFGSRSVTIADADVIVEPREAEGELHYHAFARPDGDRILFVWNRVSEQKVRIAAKTRSGPITEYGLDGSARRETLALPLEVTLGRGIPRIFRWSQRP